jgi:hypothetical protein
LYFVTEKLSVSCIFVHIAFTIAISVLDSVF